MLGGGIMGGDGGNGGEFGRGDVGGGGEKSNSNPSARASVKNPTGVLPSEAESCMRC